jgi:hypothetical protein
MLMGEIGYVVRGFLMVRRDSLRVLLIGSLVMNADPDSSLFSGDLTLRLSNISRAVTVDAVITTVHVAGRALIRDGACRSATHAVVPLRSRPGFDLERGGRLVGRYHRPPFTGCGWITPVVNLLISGPGNAVVIDLIPRAL